MGIAQIDPGIESIAGFCFSGAGSCTVRIQKIDSRRHALVHFLIIRHMDLDYGSVGQGQGQSLFTGERFCTGKQEVFVANINILIFVISDPAGDFPDGNKMFIGEFYGGNISNVQQYVAFHDVQLPNQL